MGVMARPWGWWVWKFSGVVFVRVHVVLRVVFLRRGAIVGSAVIGGSGNLDMTVVLARLGQLRKRLVHSCAWSSLLRCIVS